MRCVYRGDFLNACISIIMVIAQCLCRPSSDDNNCAANYILITSLGLHLRAERQAINTKNFGRDCHSITKLVTCDTFFSDIGRVWHLAICLFPGANVFACAQKSVLALQHTLRKLPYVLHIIHLNHMVSICYGSPDFAVTNQATDCCQSSFST